MLSPLRNRFGIPGVISVVALVFAMLGGAYAANNSGDGKATASAKAKKAKKGPRGPKGATGPAGPAGPQGPAGANGKDGANGANGSNGAAGAAGANGQSVTVSTVTLAGEEGKCVGVGGSKFAVGASKSYACNGEEGAQGSPGAPGAPGSPWTAGGTLPDDSTETGAWKLATTSAGSPLAGIPTFRANGTGISFTIPLAAPLGENEVHYVAEGEGAPEACENTAHTGTASATNPEADSGHLCVYEAFKVGLGAGLIQNPATFEAGALVSGATVNFVLPLTGGEGLAQGSWAVTG